MNNLYEGSFDGLYVLVQDKDGAGVFKREVDSQGAIDVHLSYRGLVTEDAVQISGFYTIFEI